MTGQPKLTPTTNDLSRDGKLFITAPHEPLTGEQWQPRFPSSGPIVEFKATEEPASEPEVAPLKIAVIGTAPSSRHLAPYNDPTWQIWGCSAGNMNQIPRVDMWFELHNNLLWPEHKHYGEPYIEWLKAQKFPIYMQDQRVVPNALVFPKDELTREFGSYFFTSTFAWMMAFAMKQGAKEIALFGVDMASRDEYILQRPGAYHFFMEGARRGIRMSAPYESDIMQPPPLYAYSDSAPFGRKLHAREQEMKQRISHMEGERDKLANNILYLKGALEDIDYVKSIWMGAQTC